MKIKKIVAGMVAGVMAASMMSIGASAATWDYNVHYMYYAPNNQTEETKTVIISSLNQSVDISSFYRANNTGYVHVKNPMNSSLDIISTTTMNSGNYTISVNALGTMATLEADIHNYYQSMVYSSGSINY